VLNDQIPHPSGPILENVNISLSHFMLEIIQASLFCFRKMYDNFFFFFQKTSQRFISEMEIEWFHDTLTNKLFMNISR